MAVYKNTPPIVTNGLVLNLDAGNVKSYPKSGTVWSDMSGFNNTGSLTNGPVYNQDAGGTIVFDGVDDYVAIGTPSILNITGNITVNSWIKVNVFPSSNGVGTIYEKGFDGVAEQIFFRFRDNAGTQVIDAGTYRSSGNINFMTTYTVGSSITIGSWNNIVGQYDGANWNIFLNGILVSQTLQNQGPISSTSPVSIGAAYISSGFQRFINGSISIVQVFNRSLSATEVQQNYNALKSRFGL